ncbi:hypothetical protein BH09BAC5_BH09BAC5_01430 [soil metagenome]
MANHLGIEIKKVLRNKGMSVSEFARRINKSRENIYSIFKRKSLDTDLLNNISQVLDYDFLGKETEGKLSTLRNTKKSKYPYTKVEHEIMIIREELVMLRKDIHELRGRVTKVEGKRK